MSKNIKVFSNANQFQSITAFAYLHEQAHTINDLATPILSEQNLYQDAFQGFPENKFHYLYIDLDRVLLGPDCFDENEPGYGEAMKQGFSYIQKTLGQRFGKEELNELHKLCTTGVEGFRGITEYRNGQKKLPGLSERPNRHVESCYGLQEPLTDETIQELRSTKTPPSSEQKSGLFKYIDIDFPDEYPEGRVKHYALRRDEIEEVIDCFFSTYYEKIASATSDDDRLHAIVELCRSLEVFHPFYDGNQRVIAFALLTKLLIENHLPPAILKCPYIFDGYRTIDTLINEVREGIQRFTHLKDSGLTDADLEYIKSESLIRDCKYTSGRFQKPVTASYLDTLTPQELRSFWELAVIATNFTEVSERLININYINLIQKDVLIASFITEFERREKLDDFYSSLELACLSEDIELTKELPEPLQKRLKYYTQTT